MLALNLKLIKIHYAQLVIILTLFLLPLFSLASDYTQPITSDTSALAGSSINRIVVPLYGISGDIEEVSIYTGTANDFIFVWEWYECTSRYDVGVNHATNLTNNNCVLKSQRGLSQTAVSAPDRFTRIYSPDEFTFDPTKWYHFLIIENEGGGSINIHGSNSASSVWATTTRKCIGTGNCTDLAFYPAFVISTSVEAPPDECNTGLSRICDFNPQDDDYFLGPDVDFDVQAWVNESDLDTLTNINISLRNIDQNVIFLGFLSPSDIILLDEEITTAGEYNFSTSSITLGDGNYRIRACLEKELVYSDFIPSWIFSGTEWFIDDIDDCQSHQFIVGTSTFIGNISQNLWDSTQEFLGNQPPQNAEVTSASCNPLLDFNVMICMTFLFVPDAQSMNETMTEARNSILTRVPWGYVTRTVSILSNPATTTLPSFTATLRVGPGSDMSPETSTITINPGDMIAGAGLLVDSIEDPVHGMTFREVFYPIIQGTIALMVLLIIIMDITGMFRHNNSEPSESRRSKSQ